MSWIDRLRQQTDRIIAAVVQSIVRWAGNGSLVIPLAAVIACLPRFIRGISCGHDLDFHVVSWLEVRRAWHQGIFYPHWAQSPNWSSGEARFIFYPPVTWMLGAVLSYLIGWDYVAGVMTFLILCGVGFAMRALTREFLPEPNAILAGALAAASPYALFTAYERTAFGELTAAIWIPLLILFALRATSRRLENVVSMAALLALSWLTNAPAGVMASYLLAFLAVMGAILQRSWWPVARATLAAALGLGLAAFYLVPAAWEQRWIAIQQAVDVGMRIKDSWLFARHPSMADLELHDVVLLYASLILTFTALAAAVALVFLRKKLQGTDLLARAYWIPIALLIPGIVLLQFPISAPLWNHLPKLQFLQFPWRWTMVLGVPYAVFLGAATPLRSRNSRILAAVGWCAMLLIFAAVATLFFFQSCDEEDEIRNQVEVFYAHTGVEGTDEYAPVGSDNSLVASGLPDGCLVEDPAQVLGESDTGSAVIWYAEQGSCDDTFTAQRWDQEHKLLEFDSDHKGFLILRLRRYPAWQIAVNGQSAGTAPAREDGLIVVPIPEGPVRLTVDWQITPDLIIGRWISAIAAVLLLGLWLFGWVSLPRFADAHLSS
jgi:hypothetical protein